MQLALFRKRSTAGLAGFYAEHFAPLKIGNAPSTLQTYRNTVRLWVAITGDPPLGKIDLPLVLQFRNALLAGEGRVNGCSRPRAKPTTNKELRNVRTMLRAAVKAGRLPKAPAIDKDVLLRERKRRPRAIPQQVLERIYLCTPYSWYPRLNEIPAAQWWRAAIVGAISTGFRLGALLALQWDWLDLDRMLVNLPADCDKAGQARQKPLHSAFIKSAVKIRTADPLVLPWPHPRRQFTREWQSLQAAAGIPKQERFRWHDLKRTCLTWISQVSGRPEVTQFMGDHSSIQTTMQFYLDPGAGLRDAVDRLPLPACMLEDRPVEPGRDTIPLVAG